MFDIRFIRAHPNLLDRSLQRRGKRPMAQRVLEMDTQLRQSLTNLQIAQNERNQVAKDVGLGKQAGHDVHALIERGDDLKQHIGALEERARIQQQQLHKTLSSIPNIISAECPNGSDESHNLELMQWGKIPQFSFEPKHHYELGEQLGLMDFETAVQLSGSRFVLLKGALARLERGLAQWMLDIHTTQSGYTEVSPPLLVRDAAMIGTGQLPKFHDDQFQTTTGHWLIPTAEVPLSNMVAQKILDEAQLPLRLTAHTPCFRAEAGAAGRDTRGMIRMHQFSKVELVSITTPEQSQEEHERMTQMAESILQQLELPYRKVMLCSGDLGFSAQKTYDLEVWLPAQDRYREISSCSNCGAFQARRMHARYRPKNAEAKPDFVHTLNGSGVAVGRCLIAILENYQQPNGSIRIPDRLVPYMGGIYTIEKGA
jgi:seryl-tRNA synthetase